MVSTLFLSNFGKYLLSLPTSCGFELYRVPSFTLTVVPSSDQSILTVLLTTVAPFPLAERSVVSQMIDRIIRHYECAVEQFYVLKAITLQRLPYSRQFLL